MLDYQKELEKYPDATPEDKAELEKLIAMQKDIAIGGSCEDFIRHPFFAYFEKHLNEVIADSKNKLLAVETMEELKSYKKAIEAVVEIKTWINKHVHLKNFATKAIEQYEQDTEAINNRIQEEVDNAKIL